MCETSLILKIEIRPIPEFANRMCGEEFRRGPFSGRFPRHRLGAIFAKFERRGMFWIWPSATRAVESMRLIHGQEAVRFINDGHLSANRIRNSFQRAPTCGGSFVFFNAPDFLFGH
jgi:hypothetical protein